MKKNTFPLLKKGTYNLMSIPSRRGKASLRRLPAPGWETIDLHRLLAPLATPPRRGRVRTIRAQRLLERPRRILVVKNGALTLGGRPLQPADIHQISSFFTVKSSRLFNRNKVYMAISLSQEAQELLDHAINKQYSSEIINQLKSLVEICSTAKKQAKQSIAIPQSNSTTPHDSKPKLTPGLLRNMVKHLLETKDADGQPLFHKNTDWYSIFHIAVCHFGYKETDYRKLVDLAAQAFPEGLAYPVSYRLLKGIVRYDYYKPYDQWGKPHDKYTKHYKLLVDTALDFLAEQDLPND